MFLLPQIGSSKEGLFLNASLVKKSLPYIDLREQSLYYTEKKTVIFAYKGNFIKILLYKIKFICFYIKNPTVKTVGFLIFIPKKQIDYMYRDSRISPSKTFIVNK